MASSINQVCGPWLLAAQFLDSAPSLTIYDLETGLRCCEMAIKAHCFDLSHDILVVGDQHCLKFYTAASLPCEAPFPTNKHRASVTWVQVLHSGRVLTLRTDGTLVLWDSHGGSHQQVLPPQQRRRGLLGLGWLSNPPPPPVGVGVGQFFVPGVSQILCGWVS